MMPDSTTIVTSTTPDSPQQNLVAKPWSKKFERCLRCGTQTIKHRSRGLCVKCYDHETEQRNKAHILKEARTERISNTISKEELRHEYYTFKMSLGDLARKYNCTRQYIQKLMKKYRLRRRDRATARGLAFSKGKVIQSHVDELGNITTTTLPKRTQNKSFFKSWSPDMAYVLGVLYTDGCIAQDLYRFTVAQKEPELLEKCLKLMESDAKIAFTKKRGIAGAIYKFQINGKALIEDLLKLGLKPNKSLSLDFPEVPLSYVRHFIRGCWDGDGSVYLDKNDPGKPCASFISGSERFATGILRHLVTLGMPNTRIYKRPQRNVFEFRFRGPDCAKLYHILYDGVPESIRLNRKLERFEAIARYYSENEPSTSLHSVRQGLKKENPG